MRKRDLLLIIAIKVCFTGAIAALIWLQIESSNRSERNIGIICQKLERIDGEPCNLVQPSDTGTRLFSFIKRKEAVQINRLRPTRLASLP